MPEAATKTAQILAEAAPMTSIQRAILNGNSIDDLTVSIQALTGMNTVDAVTASTYCTAALHNLMDGVASDLMEGKTQREVVQRLQRLGGSPDVCAAVVSGLAKALAETNAKARQNLIARGFLWCVGGVVASYISYVAAAPGGTYLVFWGAILWGGRLLWKALRIPTSFR